MLNELTKEIKAHLYDKIKGPLFFTFVVSWVAFNIRSITVFFSNVPVDAKFAYWNAFYPTQIDYFVHGICYPFAAAVIIILIYPIPARLAYHYWHWQYLKVKRTQQKLEDATPMTQAEADALRKSLLEQEIQVQAKIQGLATDNRELSLQNSELKSRLVNLNNDLAQRESEMQGLVKDYERGINKISELESEQALLQDSNRQLSEEVMSLNKKLATLESIQRNSRNKSNSNELSENDRRSAEFANVKENLKRYKLNLASLKILADLVKHRTLLISDILNTKYADEIELHYSIDQLLSSGLADKDYVTDTLTLNSEGIKVAVESGFSAYTKKHPVL